MTDEEIERLETTMRDRAFKDGAYATALATYVASQANAEFLARIAVALEGILDLAEHLNETRAPRVRS